MNVEIGTEAALFPEKEYINGIFLAVHISTYVLSILLYMGFMNIQVPLLPVLWISIVTCNEGISLEIRYT